MMETEVLYAGELEEKALQMLIKDETFLHTGIFLGERLPQVIVKENERQDLLYLARYSDCAFSCIDYTSGRIFDTDFELRWEKHSQIWQVVYLGKECALPLLDKVHSFVLQSRRSKHYYLFGKSLQEQQIPGIPHEANLFAEARIPRLLHYRPAPLADEKKPRVRLVTYEYLDKVGRVQAYRFAELERAE